ncbi:MAG: cysteine hydrolase [Candidatus Heimdallarchaeaceae archaeon]
MSEGTIEEKWEEEERVKIPEIKEVRIRTRETALIVMDLQNENCNEERRPRCVKTLYVIQNMLEEARKREMEVIYTLTSAAAKMNIRKEVMPKREEKIIKGGVDKFYKTELEDILRKKRVKRVILVGTAANGAILHTATGAAERNFEVIIPINGISAATIFEEKYAIWHLANGPGTRRKITITKTEKMNYS